MLLTFIISTLCGILSAHVTWSGEPIIELLLLTSEPDSSKQRTIAGSLGATKNEINKGNAEVIVYYCNV